MSQRAEVQLAAIFEVPKAPPALRVDQDWRWSLRDRGENAQKKLSLRRDGWRLLGELGTSKRLAHSAQECDPACMSSPTTTTSRISLVFQP